MAEKREKRVTLQEVANAAGVSAMSVSKALNNKGGLSKKTADHIIKTARQLNYKPNMIAKSLRVHETMTLGVVLSDSSEMVISKVLRGIADSAEQQNYSVILYNTDSDHQKERRAVEMLHNKRIDGLLAVASTLTSDEDCQWLKSFDIPTVLLMRESRHNLLDSIMNDNFKGGYQLASHLIEQGCRKFCFLSLTSISQSGGDRLAGANKAMEEKGVVYDEAKIFHILPTTENGYEAMRKLLDMRLDFDAVMCGCDLIAIGVVKALLEAGIRIPEQVCVCGYDDIDLLDYLQVPLTTMRQPLYEIGKNGVNLLLERIKNPEMPIQRSVLLSTLVARKSSVTHR